MAGKNKATPVAIIMGSDSDWRIMQSAAKTLDHFGVKYAREVVSAHRTPVEMQEFARGAADRYKIIIAGAGGAAHLPGMVASLTSLPVIGVPVALKHLDGLDSLLSVAQMPKGVPVATMAIDNAENAALLAVRILSLSDPALKKKLESATQSLKLKVTRANKKFKRIK